MSPFSYFFFRVVFRRKIVHTCKHPCGAEMLLVWAGRSTRLTIMTSCMNDKQSGSCS